MVVLGILAAVAIPKMGGTITSSEEAAENSVIASLRSAVEVYAMDQVVANSVKSYPSNPFAEMDKVPDGYSGLGAPDLDGEWTFTSEGYVAHQRNDNSKYKWFYNDSLGTFGDRVAY
jgi:type II secretory pathway pseudopilin PulG